MMLRESHTIVIVPGLRGHVEEHWQTRQAGAEVLLDVLSGMLLAAHADRVA